MALTFSSRNPRRLRVLIVDDDEDTRVMYAEFLGAWFEVLQAGDAREALAVVGREAPDAVVADVTLPGMDGFELVRQLRRIETARRIPVISLSGHSGLAHEERAREAGCDRIVQKPCLPDVLADTLKQLLEEPPKRSKS